VGGHIDNVETPVLLDDGPCVHDLCLRFGLGNGQCLFLSGGATR
jgi:hypothetical protein